MNSLMEVLKSFEGLQNKTIIDNIVIAWSKINNPLYENILCSVSGGSDSDIMLDIVYKCDKDKKVKYVWFDTGLEYKATKEHLDYLEKRYGITIHRERAIKPIPLCCKEYGQPFLSKQISHWIKQLQKNDFKWEDKPFDELIKEYPKGCVGALRWWTNDYSSDGREKSKFDIANHKYLKEFMLQNPPTFRVSNLCCDYAKKKVAIKYKEENKIDLNMYGVRRAEGGIRAIAYENCFTSKDGEADEYRPLFWYTDEDKKDYEENQNIKHSDCYNVYGFRRTGCAACPYGWIYNGLYKELKQIKKYESQLYKACNNIFGDSYEYTQKYLEFRKMMKNKEHGKKVLF